MRMAHGAPLRASNKSRNNGKGLPDKFDHRLGIVKCSFLSDEQTVRVCKRFYVALILSKLVQVIFFLFYLHFFSWWRRK